MTHSVLLRRVRIVELTGAAAAGPTDLLIENGVITALAAGFRRPAGVAEIDGAGRWAIPGLWDAHVHVAQWVRTARMLELGAAASAEDVLDVVGRHIARSSDDGRVVLGFGYRSAGWPRLATVAELDAVSGGRPVALVSGDAHNGWLNTTAFVLLGVPARTGPVSEHEWFELLRRLDDLPGAAPAAADFVAPLAELAGRGVTGLVDFEFENTFLDWPGRIAAGADLLRVRCATYPHQLEQVRALGLRSGDPLPGTGGLAAMGPLKIISDGSLNSRTAWTREPYSDGPASAQQPCGQANYSLPELVDLLGSGARAGLEVAVHAIGDRANGVALDAIAATGARGSIEHAQLITDADIRRMAGLGVRASVQPAHLLDDRDLTERVWGARAAMAFPLRTMLRAGVDLRFGSDAPVAPPDPWLAMATAVHRSGDERAGWYPEQSLTPREALTASVDGRRLAPGQPGDVVLLDVDPVALRDDPAATASALRGVRPALTLCAGRVTHTTL